MSPIRSIAAQIINNVASRGQSLTDNLDTILLSILDPRDRAFTQAITYGVCRYYPRLLYILNQLLKKPIPPKESIIQALLLIGLYQLTDMHIPPHAAVAETVDATILLKKPLAKNLVNAILREYLRQEKNLHEKIKLDAEAYYAHPDWFITRIKEVWPMHWQTILHANNAHPPFALRVNVLRMSRKKYIELLQTNGYLARVIPNTPAGIILEPAIPIERLPGFAQGEVSVQDGGAQLAAELLELEPGLRVLDACAAPGGKLTHLLEREPTLATCIAIEKDSKRLARIKENVSRLLLPAPQLFTRDASRIKTWWDGQLFDRILLDVPCSASGVIRRHPDIKLLRQANDIKTLAKKELHLLTSLWHTLKPGGLLLYVTCSIFPEENAHVLQQFLTYNPHAYEEKLEVPWGMACEIGRQILPGMQDMDGFYFAKMRKKSVSDY